MAIELAYKKLLAEHNLTVDQLPKDAQTGIKSIDQILGAINLVEKKGQTPKPAVFDKIRANDKWVVREILDFVDETNKNTDPLPNDPTKVVAEIKEEIKDPEKKEPETKTEPVVEKTEAKPAEATGPDPKGVRIDEELKALLDSGKTKLTLEEVKSGAPTAYGVIFDSYTPGSENGIETSVYKLIETEKEVFTLSKI